MKNIYKPTSSQEKNSQNYKKNSHGAIDKNSQEFNQCGIDKREKLRRGRDHHNIYIFESQFEKERKRKKQKKRSLAIPKFFCGLMALNNKEAINKTLKTGELLRVYLKQDDLKTPEDQRDMLIWNNESDKPFEPLSKMGFRVFSVILKSFIGYFGRINYYAHDTDSISGQFEDTELKEVFEEYEFYGNKTDKLKILRDAIAEIKILFDNFYVCKGVDDYNKRITLSSMWNLEVFEGQTGDLYILTATVGGLKRLCDIYSSFSIKDLQPSNPDRLSRLDILALSNTSGRVKLCNKFKIKKFTIDVKAVLSDCRKKSKYFRARLLAIVESRFSAVIKAKKCIFSIVVDTCTKLTSIGFVSCTKLIFKNHKILTNCKE